jgi:hypothetical protein
MPIPATEDWMKILNLFSDKLYMPNCIGSIDGKHRRIKCPPQAGLLYYNYKACNSVFFLGVADANCCFTLTSVGAYE